MDNLLLPYLHAADQVEAQQHLDELLTVDAAPFIRRTLSRRLGFYVSSLGTNPRNPDAEDLYQGILANILETLSALRARTSDAEIVSFPKYVTWIADKACVDFMRSKSPARARLKNNLRDLFRRHEDFTTWREDSELLCGFKAWEGMEPRLVTPSHSSDLDVRLGAFETSRFAQEDVRQVPLSRLVAELLHWVGEPIELDLLVRMVATLRDLKDSPLASLDDDRSGSMEASLSNTVLPPDWSVHNREFLTEVWQVVKSMPASHRDAYCFSFEDNIGQDLIGFLITAGVANLRHLAEGLERSVEELMRLRAKMPMDTDTVAAELNASRDQVYKWRHRAIQRLKAELFSLARK